MQAPSLVIQELKTQQEGPDAQKQAHLSPVVGLATSAPEGGSAL